MISPGHTSSPLRIGIIGTGLVTRYHVEAISRTPGVELTAVCRSDPARAAETAARLGVPCEVGLDALLARDDVDAVCICTPSGLHAAQTIAAAQAGKHVLVEKPMALTLADADAMIRACRAANVRLAVALQRRADPTYRSIAEAIVAGELGRPVLASVSVPYNRNQHYYDSANWRGTWTFDGGGVLMNQGIHLVDLLIWYLGEPVSVTAQAATLARAIEVEDTITATLRFAGGALGSILATTATAPSYPHRVEIYGDGGGIQIEGETVMRWESTIAGAQARVVAGRTASAKALGTADRPASVGAEGHVRLMADFAAAIRSGRDPLVTGEEGRRSLAVVRAIYEAAGLDQ